MVLFAGFYSFVGKHRITVVNFTLDIRQITIPFKFPAAQTLERQPNSKWNFPGPVDTTTQHLFPISPTTLKRLVLLIRPTFPGMTRKWLTTASHGSNQDTHQLILSAVSFPFAIRRPPTPSCYASHRVGNSKRSLNLLSRFGDSSSGKLGTEHSHHAEDSEIRVDGIRSIRTLPS
jgi:hypothetical protein